MRSVPHSRAEPSRRSRACRPSNDAASGARCWSTRRSRSWACSRFSALVVDYGILWSARRQAQNAADAGAMAAAVSLAYRRFRQSRPGADLRCQHRARQLRSGAQRRTSSTADVTFPPARPGRRCASTNACVRVDVFRNQRANGNPLPTIFGRLVGVTDQGVQATATAQVLYGDSADCVKPWAIPDKWDEFNPTSHRRGIRTTNSIVTARAASLLSPGRLLRAAWDRAPATTARAPDSPARASVINGGDYGLEITLEDRQRARRDRAGLVLPRRRRSRAAVGGDCYRGRHRGLRRR